MLFSVSQKRGDSHPILYRAVRGMEVKAFWVSGEKLFFVWDRTERGMVQMQKSALVVWGVPDFV